MSREANKVLFNNSKARQYLSHCIDQKKQSGMNYKSLSLAIGKSPAYIYQYLVLGSPKHLPEDIRYKIAQILHCDQEKLTDLPILSSSQGKLNKEHLSVIIRVVEEWLKDNSFYLDPQTKAELIIALYEKTAHITPENKKAKIIELSDFFLKTKVV